MFEKVGHVAYLSNRRRKASTKRRKTTTSKRRRVYPKVTRKRRKARRNPVVEYRKGGRKIRRKISMATLRAKVKRPRRRRARRNPVEGTVNRRRRPRVVVVNRRRRVRRNPIEGTVNRRRRRARTTYAPRRRRRSYRRNPVEGTVNRRRRRHYRRNPIEGTVNRRRRRHYRRNPLLRQTPNRKEQVWRILSNGLGMGLGLSPILLRNQIYKWIGPEKATSWWGHLLANYMPSIALFGAGYGLNYASKNGNEFSMGLMMGAGGSFVFNAIDHIIGMVNDVPGSMPMLASKSGLAGEDLLLGETRLLGSEYDLLGGRRRRNFGETQLIGAPPLRGYYDGETQLIGPPLRGYYGEDMDGEELVLGPLSGDEAMGDLNAYMMGDEIDGYDLGEDFEGEDFEGPPLRGEDFYGPPLRGEDFEGEDMDGEDFEGEDFFLLGDEMGDLDGLDGEDMDGFDGELGYNLMKSMNGGTSMGDALNGRPSTTFRQKQQERDYRRQTINHATGNFMNG